MKMKKNIELQKSIYSLLGLLCIQLCIGMTNVIFKLPLVTAVSHNIMAVLVLLAMITVIFKLVVMQRKVGAV
jgi:cytochrome c oxidase assembly protein subunit 15